MRECDIVDIIISVLFVLKAGKMLYLQMRWNGYLSLWDK